MRGSAFLIRKPVCFLSVSFVCLREAVCGMNDILCSKENECL